MADLVWPQNAPPSTTPVASGDTVGMYKPAEPGATKNVQVDVDEIAAFASVGLQSQITQNANDIDANTAAITANTGLIDDNAVAINALELSRQVNLPIGTILMYDGASWTDNSTLPGWYSCIAANAGVGCPNLVDSFIKGRTPAVAASTGGANSRTLTEANLAPHTHGAAGSHTHVVRRSYGSNLMTGGTNDYVTVFGGITAPVISTDESGSHSHPSVGSGTAFDNQPQYYTLIYIRRCS